MYLVRNEAKQTVVERMPISQCALAIERKH